MNSKIWVHNSGVINIDYLNENKQKKELSSLLRTHNLSHAVNFATGTQNNSSNAINNIFVDKVRLGSPSLSHITNGLSDHDFQFFTINNIVDLTNIASVKKKTRKINNETIMQIMIPTISLTLFCILF